MTTISRREALRATAIMLATPAVVAAGGAQAAGGAAVLVAPYGKLDPDIRDLAGMRICTGGVGSSGDRFLRERGALAINVPLAERYGALQRGICEAMVFVSDEKSAEELTQEIRVFMPFLDEFEFRPLDLD